MLNYRSFFDKNEESGEDVTASRKIQKEELLNFKVTFSAKAGRKVVKLEKTVNRFFYIANNYIYWKKEGDDKNVRGIFDLNWSRVNVIEIESLNDESYSKDYKFAIRLVKNAKYLEILVENEGELLKWERALSSKVIHTKFHENYRAIKCLGKGAFGKVYLVKRSRDGYKFAVKAFTKEYILSLDKGKASLVNEIKILRELDHNNVIKLYEVAETQNSIYLIMEYVDGKPIFDLCKSKILDADYIRDVMFQLFNGLQYLKGKGILHRDLKPDNILIEKNSIDEGIPKLKIIDFGLSTFTDESHFIFKRCGTPGFIAPEVFKQDKLSPVLSYDYQVDLFSAGILYFCMVTGKNPFDGPTYSTVFNNNNKGSITWNFREILLMDPIENALLRNLMKLEPSERITVEQALKSSYFNPLRKKMVTKTTGDVEHLANEIAGKKSYMIDHALGLRAQPQLVPQNTADLERHAENFVTQNGSDLLF